MLGFSSPLISAWSAARISSAVRERDCVAFVVLGLANVPVLSSEIALPVLLYSPLSLAHMALSQLAWRFWEHALMAFQIAQVVVHAR
jgi:hypothetical protein